MKTRILSAVVASILGIIVLIFHKTFVYPLAIALITGLMVYELLRAGDCLKNKCTSAVLIFFAFCYQFTHYKYLIKYRRLFIFVVLMLCFLTFLIEHENFQVEKFAFMIASSMLVTFAMNTLILIKIMDMKHGLFYLILSLLGAWLADSGAYFAGTLFGKHKLCPKISPKKTIEGLVGGTIVNGILFVVIGIIYTQICSTTIHMNYVYLALLGIICSLLGLMGDLTASVIKRQHNIKDYGNIMPGHGGAMDRFDSILFVVPGMYLALQFINIIK